MLAVGVVEGLLGAAGDALQLGQQLLRERAAPSPHPQRNAAAGTASHSAPLLFSAVKYIIAMRVSLFARRAGGP